MPGPSSVATASSRDRLIISICLVLIAALAWAYLIYLARGAYCLGCCWALMSVLFVVGVMNLVWVAVLTGFVLLEKVSPAGAVAARLAGVGMVAIGIFIVV